MSNAVATTNQRQLSSNQPKFSVFMNQEQIKGLVSQAVGKNAQRFTASIISAVSTNPAFGEVHAEVYPFGARFGAKASGFPRRRSSGSITLSV